MFNTPSTPFRALLADPPWPFRDRGSRFTPDYEGQELADQSHYEILTVPRICESGWAIKALVAPDSFLFLWSPNALVLDGTATRVARAWGFEPKQLIPWVKVTNDRKKPRIGGGHYTRVCTEQLLLCRRGKAKVRRRNIPGVIHAPRTEHSQKPDESYHLIEALVEGPYLELFARRRFSDVWTAWGDELC